MLKVQHMAHHFKDKLFAGKNQIAYFNNQIMRKKPADNNFLN
jgi:hypothetical protein